MLAKHSSVEGTQDSFQEYEAALKQKQEFDQQLGIAEQRVTALDQLVTFVSLHFPNPSHDQGLKILRDTASFALLKVADVVHNNNNALITIHGIPLSLPSRSNRV